MTEVIKEPKKRSRVNLIILLALLVLLVVGGGYWLYGWGLKGSGSADTDQIEQNNQNNNLIDNQKINNESNQAASIPDGWKEYELSECGVIIQIPEDWQIESNPNEKSVIFNSNNTIKSRKDFVKNGGVWEGYHDLSIACYNSLEEMTQSSWTFIKADYPNFENPKNIYDALTRLNPSSDNKDMVTVLNTYEVKPVSFNNKSGLQALQGGLGESLNLYFQQNKRIVVFITDVSSRVDTKDKNLKEPQKTIINTFEWL